MRTFSNMLICVYKKIVASAPRVAFSRGKGRNYIFLTFRLQVLCEFLCYSYFKTCYDVFLSLVKEEATWVSMHIYSSRCNPDL